MRQTHAHDFGHGSGGVQGLLGKRGERDTGQSSTGAKVMIALDSDIEGKIAVICAGYVGLVTSAGLADLGHIVTWVEIDPDRLARLDRGDVSIYEPGLDVSVARNRMTGSQGFTTDKEVKTSLGPDGQGDTSFIFAPRVPSSHTPRLA